MMAKAGSFGKSGFKQIKTLIDICASDGQESKHQTILTQ